MQTTTDQNPPAPAQADADELIVARVHLPSELFLMKRESGVFSLIPLHIIGETVRLDLAARALPAQVDSSGSLDSGLVVVKTSRRPECLAALHDLFQRLGLFDWCSLYYFDEREMFLRPVHVGLGASQPFGWDELRAELARHAASIVCAKTILHLLKERFAKKNPAPPVPPLDGAQNPS